MPSVLLISSLFNSDVGKRLGCKSYKCLTANVLTVEYLEVSPKDDEDVVWEESVQIPCSGSSELRFQL